MNIAIVGSRDFANIEYYQKHMPFNDALKKYEKVYKDALGYIKSIEQFDENATIVSGGAKGADALAERVADELNLKKVIIKPDWNTHGRKAGFIRNIEIVEISDIVIAFWNGKSQGTKSTILEARRKGKQVYIKFV